MSQILKIRRGAEGDLPTLALGELGFTTDSKELYIGNGVSNTFLCSVELTDGSTTSLHTHNHASLSGAGIYTHTEIDTHIDRVEGVFNDTYEPTGFIDRTTSTISFADGTRVFTIAPVGSSFSYYISGAKYTQNSSDTIQISDTEGMHHIYYDGTTLSEMTSFDISLIYDYAYVAAIYWDATNSKHIYMGDERHGCTMSPDTHANIHLAEGTRFISGCSLGDIQAGENGDLDEHAEFSISAGTIMDEDITHSLPALSAGEAIPKWYKDGANGYWREALGTASGILSASGGNNRAVWNEWTGVTWQLTEVDRADWVCSHIIATNDSSRPYVAIIGQAEYNTRGLAEEGASTELNSLITTGLPSEEWVVIATLLYRTNDSLYDNQYKSLIDETDDGGDYIDWRFSQLSPSTGSVSAHNNLSNRDATNAHPGTAISTSTTNFNGILSASDSDVQTALDTIDDHTHDSRYYTESEVDSALSGKADSSHTHDSRYYTESEVDSALSGKADSSHTHDKEDLTYSPSSQGSNFSASVNNVYRITSGGITIYLPGSPSTDDWIEFIPAANLASSNVAITRNGNRIAGAQENFTWDMRRGFRLVFDSTSGWEVC